MKLVSSSMMRITSQCHTGFTHHKNSHFTSTSPSYGRDPHKALSLTTKDNMKHFKDSSSSHPSESVIRSPHNKLASPPTGTAGSLPSQSAQSGPGKDSGSNQNKNGPAEAAEQRPTRLTSFSVMDILSPSKFKPPGVGGPGIPHPALAGHPAHPHHPHRGLPLMPGLKPLHPGHHPAHFITAPPGVDFLAARLASPPQAHMRHLPPQESQASATASKPAGNLNMVIFTPCNHIQNYMLTTTFLRVYTVYSFSHYNFELIRY